MVAEIILIGTNHSDITGPKRLESVLEELKPDIITVESEESLDIPARTRMDRIANIGIKAYVADFASRHPDIDQSYAESFFQTYGYEFFVAEAYAKKKGIANYSIDCLHELMQQSGETLTPERTEYAVAEILQIPFPIFLKQMYGDQFDYDPSIITPEIIAGMTESLNNDLSEEMLRDTHMANKINELVAENSDAKIVHIGGSHHLLTRGETQGLYGGLSAALELDSQRFYLGELCPISSVDFQFSHPSP